MGTSHSKMSNNILRATHAGSWYPRGQELTNQLNDAFGRATVDASAQGYTKAIVVPHAGYTYCLKTAAHAFKTIDTSRYERVIIMGPSHRVYIRHCTIADAQTFETPLGMIPFDNEAAKKLCSEHPNLFKRLPCSTAEQEHSLEMECPILKYIFKDKLFSVLPIMVGAISDSQAREIAKALEPLINDPKTLVVVSSDFCHWGSDFDYTYLPDVEGSINQRIEALDREGMAKISTCDVNQFAEFISRTGDTICGELPIKIAMMGISAKYTVSWPSYSQSSTVRSKRDTSVSYAAGVFRI